MKTILILEEEAYLMRLLHHMLRGYIVLQASNAQEALQSFEENTGKVGLFIADVTLPASSGVEVALALRRRDPALPIILTSGYPESAWNDRDILDLQRLGSDSVVIVQKPFNRQHLLECVHKLTGDGATVERAGSSGPG